MSRQPSGAPRHFQASIIEVAFAQSMDRRGKVDAIHLGKLLLNNLSRPNVDTG